MFQSPRSRYSLSRHAKEALGDETFHGVRGRLFCQGYLSGYFGKLFFLTRMNTLTYMKRALTVLSVGFLISLLSIFVDCSSLVAVCL